MSIYEVNSSFPSAVDDIAFISDVNLDTLEIYKHHRDLVNNGKYTEASNYLNQQTGITSVNADFFNMLENRIYQTQLYVKNKEKVNPCSYVSQPTNVSKINPIWISDSKV